MTQPSKGAPSGAPKSELAIPRPREVSDAKLFELGRVALSCTVPIEMTRTTIRGESETYGGSGILYAEGDDFVVLTARHNLKGYEPREVTVRFPGLRITTLPRPGQSIKGFCYLENDEVDVGVIELNRADRDGWAHMVPLGPEHLDCAIVDTDTLIVCGYPVDRVAPMGEVHTPDGQRIRVDGAGSITVRTHLVVGARHEGEPSKRQGFRVLYAPASTDIATGGSVRTGDPKGLSGGPVLAFGEQVKLVGLVRSHDSEMLWCESAADALFVFLSTQSNDRFPATRARLAQLTDQSKEHT